MQAASKHKQKCPGEAAGRSAAGGQDGVRAETAGRAGVPCWPSSWMASSYGQVCVMADGMTYWPPVMNELDEV